MSAQTLWPVVPGWIAMWIVAVVEFFGLKLATLRGSGGAAAPRWTTAYLLLWPGMNAKAFLRGRAPAYVVELKIDGVAMSLSYENGLLAVAATRGNGERGDDVTHNVRTMPGVPLRLDTDKPPKLFEVRLVKSASVNYCHAQGKVWTN